MKVVTNNQPRDVLYWHELSEKERADFDYLDSEDQQSQASFFRYRGEVYDLGEFMGGAEKPWHGVHTDSYFSAILVRYVDDNERVIVARAYS